MIKTPPAPEIPWEDAVAEGKRLVAESERLVAEANQVIATSDLYDWRLAELADRVEPRYGENTLAKYADEIRVAACTLKRRRTTYRHYKEILKSDPGLLLPYSVARTLEKHPDRERLIKANPKMTRREAADLMKAHRNPRESETKRLWDNLIRRAGKATADETFSRLDRETLLDVVEQPLLNDLREGAQAWIRLAEALEKLFNEPTGEASFDDAENEAFETAGA